MLKKLEKFVGYAFSLLDKSVEDEWIFQDDIPKLSNIHPLLVPVVKCLAVINALIFGLASLAFCWLLGHGATTVVLQYVDGPLELIPALLVWLLPIALIAAAALVTVYILKRSWEVLVENQRLFLRILRGEHDKDSA